MNDEAYMKQALELAEEGRGLTSPGAMVGCVIVNDGQVVGAGSYTYDGVKHAEVLALQEARDRARGATVYVSLEPCSHKGRTPPCTETLIAAGVSRLVAAIEDPYPEVRGNGLARLREAGIEVECGVLADEGTPVERDVYPLRRGRSPFRHPQGRDVARRQDRDRVRRVALDHFRRIQDGRSGTETRCRRAGNRKWDGSHR